MGPGLGGMADETRGKFTTRLDGGWMVLTGERTTPIIISESGRDTNVPQRFAESDKSLLSYRYTDFRLPMIPFMCVLSHPGLTDG